MSRSSRAAVDKGTLSGVAGGKGWGCRLWAYRLVWCVLLFLMLLPVGRSRCFGEELAGQGLVYRDPETGYQVWVEDKAGLLNEEQLKELAQVMQEITAYGNAAFLTTDRNASSTEELARSYYRDRFGTDSGTLLVIDMDRRNIWIHSDGAVWKVVTSAYADTITDNVYRYASRGDYHGCAREAFEEIYTLLKGQRIAQPMKYISNAVLAMILALLGCYGMVIRSTRLDRPKRSVILADVRRDFRCSELKAVHTHQTKVYDPAPKGGSGGSRGGSGSSGGGGGRSGGGGGHRF